MARVLLLISVLAAVPARADDMPEANADGCNHSKVLSQMTGCLIQSCEVRDFDSANVTMKVNEDGFPVEEPREGQLERLQYICPTRVSPLQIARNAQGALTKAGYTLIYKRDGEDPIVTAQKGAQWLALKAWKSNENAYYEQVAVLTKEMAQEMTASADDMLRELQANQRVAVYGINFDANKAVLTSDSQAVLAEVQKLLANTEGLRLRIEGHTETKGDAKLMLKLSESRAAAVKSWLVEHGIDGKRLETKGFGGTKPVSNEDTKEARAKNRRVELAKI